MLVAFILRQLLVHIEPFDPVQSEEQLRDIGKYRGIKLVNQTSILFSSEPDISLVGRDGTTVGVIEIKGGTDPAGALERYGAAKKSFEKILRDAPAAKTIIIASCITPEVHERIERDSTVFKYYNLTKIVKEGEDYQDLLNLVFSLLDAS